MVLGCAALLGLTAVALQSLCAAIEIATYERAVYYQLFYALAAALIALSQNSSASLLTGASLLFILGALFFSGGHYLHFFTGVSQWQLLAPIGQLLSLGGWFTLFLHACRE